MGRSLKKGPFVDAKLYKKVDRLNDRGVKEAITTWARACTIIPEFVGHTFMVHNGKTHLKVFVTEDMVGHRLGEFAPTRSFRGHGGKAKKEAAAAGAPGPAQPAGKGG
jgi:small subunit ribosomal protein S19